MSSESDAAPKKNGDKNLPSNLPLKSLGIYTIERKLGQGGMGTVYLATHTKLKKLVALKVLPRDKAKNPVLVRRFQAEAQAAGQLEHPNIVPVKRMGICSSRWSMSRGSICLSRSSGGVRSR
jgi:serine/threonine-protein kinase